MTRPFVFALAALLATIAPAEVVHGTIKNAKGEPIQGAVVTAASMPKQTARAISMTVEAKTDSEGKFTLETTKIGYGFKLPTTLFVKEPDGHYGIAELKEDSADATVSDAQTSLCATIKDSSGRPIPGATLKIIYFSGSLNRYDTFGSVGFKDEYRVVADASGQVRVAELPVRVGGGCEFDAPGYNPRSDYVQFRPNQPVELSITLYKPAYLCGRVLEGGRAVPDVVLSAQSSDSNARSGASAKTDAQGTYKLALDPGIFVVRAILGNASKDWTAAAFKNIALKEGAEIDGLDFHLDHGLVVKGVVLTRLTGKPVPNAHVFVGQDGSMVDTTTDKAGRFSLRASPGEIVVVADSVDGRRFQQAQLYETISDGANPLVELRLPDALLYPPVNNLSGIVTDANGSPVSGAVVINWTSNASCTTDAGGRYRFDVPSLPGQLIIAEKGDSMSAKGAEVLDKPAIDLRIDAKAAGLEGQVLDQDGQPLANADVTLGGKYGETNLPMLQTKTDPNGGYRFGGLFGGADSYFLWAKKEGYGDGTIQPIRTSPSEDQKLKTLTLSLADGAINGLVLGPDGKAVPKARVDSQTRLPDSVVFTDDEGRFRLTGVPRGSHYLVVSTADNGMRGVQQAKTGDKDVLVRLRQSPGRVPGIMSGDRTGRPSPAIRVARWFGPSVDLSSLKGKIVVLDMWAIWCHPCVESLPKVESFYQKYKDRGVVVIGLHLPDTSKEKVAAFLTKQNLTYPMAIDLPDKTGFGATCAAFGPSGIPHVIVIGPDGRIISDSDDIDEADVVVRKLLNP